MTLADSQSDSNLSNPWLIAAVAAVALFFVWQLNK